jgi:hypothetical protein
MGWILVRAFGIVVGIATLLRLATTEKLVTYEPLFQQWLEVLTEFVDYAFLTKFIGPGLLLAIDYFRSLGIPVPDLQDEWRPAFVLSLLVLGAAARNVRTGWFVVAAPCLALACAVVAGLTGTVTPVLFFAFAPAFALKFDFGIAFAAFSALAAYVADPVAAVVLVATAAALLLFFGIRENWYLGSLFGYRAVFHGAQFNTGFDILSAMLGALFLASWFASPPTW